MAKSRSRDLADIIGKKSIYTSNHADVQANNGVTLSQISIDLNAVESKITNDTSTLASNTYVNSQISSTQSNIDVETARIDLVNSNLTASNTAIRSLISSNDGDISTLQGRATALETEDGDLWTGLTGTNTAIRSLVSVESARVDVLNTNLTGTNTAIRSLISSNDGDITALQGRATALETEDTNLWSAITSTNTAIRGVISSEVSGLVDSAPATLDTLNELAAALGDDANFATTLTTNLGQKLGASATVTLSGDVTGTANFSANAVSITTTIADDSHNHIIANVDGLQADLNTRATWSGLTGTNTAIRSLVSDESARIDLVNTNLTGTNTAIRSLVSDESARVDVLNTNLVGTNTAIRSLVSDQSARVDLVNTNLTASNTAIRALITSNDGDITALQGEDTNLWSALVSTNTAIRSYTDTAVANLVDSSPAALDTLNELAAALGDDANFATTLTTNLGQKLGSTATVTLSGDVTGTANFSANAITITTAIADDSHNHIVGNVDGLQTALDAKATWTGLTGTNTAIRSLISSNDSDISALQGRATALETEDGDLWTGLTGTNTAIRSLISSNDSDISALQGRATALETEDGDLWTGLTGTNTAIRSLVSDESARVDLLNSNLLSTNTAIRSYTDSSVADLVASAPATLDTLNELAAALGDDANFATTLTTNLGQKLGASASVTLTGAVSGSASFSANAVSLSTAFANSGVVAGAYGSATLVPVVTVGADGRITSMSTQTVAGVTGTEFTTANNNFRISVADGTTFDTVINVSDKATWTELLSTNTAIRSLISSNDSDITALQTEDGDLWTGITGTNTAIRSLISSNDSDISALQTEDGDLWTGLTGTNTAIRSLVSDQSARIDLVNSNLTASNTAIRAYTDSAVADLVASAPATLDTLNELAAALGDDPSFATTLTTNLGQKLGASATVTLTGDVTGSGSFSSNTASFAVSISDDFASNAHLSSTYVSNTVFQTYAANNSYVFSELAYTATAGQQSFTGVDNFGTTLDYTAGKISVFMNGIMLLAGSDYLAANTTSIWLNDGAAASDIISVQTYTSAQNFIEKNADFNTASATLSGTSAQTIDSFGIGDARTAKYLVEIKDTSTGAVHSMEVLLTHDDTNVVITEYASVATGSDLGTCDASITGSTLTVTCTPTVSASAVKVVKLATVA